MGVLCGKGPGAVFTLVSFASEKWLSCSSMREGGGITVAGYAARVWQRWETARHTLVVCKAKARGAWRTGWRQAGGGVWVRRCVSTRLCAQDRYSQCRVGVRRVNVALF